MCRLSHRNVINWTAIISGYTQSGQARHALKLYQHMQEAGVQPNAYTFVSLLKACGSIADVEEGRRIHLEALKHKCTSDLFVGNCLIDMYGKCGNIVEAENVFEMLPQRDVVSWNVMMSTYVEHDQAEKALFLYARMQDLGMIPDSRSLVSAIRACGMVAEIGANRQSEALEKGKAIHVDACRNHHHMDVYVGSTLISMYGKCGSITDARNVFDLMLERNVVSWNAMLAAYVDQELAHDALQLYEKMQQNGVSAGVRTFVTLIRACGMLAEKEEGCMQDLGFFKVMSLYRGKQLHADCRRKGYDSDVFVGSTLISMYGKCGSIEDARIVFDGLSNQNLVSCNTLLAVYVDHGQAEDVLQLYERLTGEGLIPDAQTYVRAFQACGMLAAVEGRSTKVHYLEIGWLIHADAQRRGCCSSTFVANTLMSMYAKCGSIQHARHVFDALLQRDVVTWNVMLAAYAEHGESERGLKLYKQMQQEGFTPDELTLVGVLQVCSKLGALATTRQIHCSLVSCGKQLSLVVGSALIHAYGHCSSMEDAQRVFNELPKYDVVSWTALIAGYAREGNTAASLLWFEKLKIAGLRPSAVTCLSVLSACSHAGLVDKGVEYFEAMSKDHGLAPAIEHYATIVDLLGRAGCFQKIEVMLSAMPMQPNLVLWYSLLAACRKYGKVVLGKRAFDHIVLLEPNYAAAYVVMSSIYADAGLWDHAEDVNELGQKVGASKKPGQSWIEHGNGALNFVVGDSTHSQLEQLYSLVGTLRSKLSYVNSCTASRLVSTLVNERSIPPGLLSRENAGLSKAICVGCGASVHKHEHNLRILYLRTQALEDFIKTIIFTELGAVRR